MNAVAAGPIVKAVFGEEVSLYQVMKAAAQWAVWTGSKKRSKPPKEQEAQDSIRTRESDSVLIRSSLAVVRLHTRLTVAVHPLPPPHHLD